MAQPKIKSKVICSGVEVGEVSRIVVDSLTAEISHLAVKTDRGEILVPVAGNIDSFTENQVHLSLPSESLSQFNPFRRDDYVDLNQVEMGHLTRHLNVHPGEVLVPLPALEKNIERRSFLTKFTGAIGGIMGLALSFPVLKYLIHPMYEPLDNSWIQMGHIKQLSRVDVPRKIKYSKTVKEGYLVRTFKKSHWAVNASPELLTKITGDKDREFRDKNGKVIWINKKDVDTVVFSGKCPHLGCAYRWRKHKRFGPVFVCPCHLSIFAPNGDPLEGPSPRGLDVMPVRVAGNGGIQIIDLEYKAGKKAQIRIV